MSTHQFILWVKTEIVEKLLAEVGKLLEIEVDLSKIKSLIKRGEYLLILD